MKMLPFLQNAVASLWFRSLLAAGALAGVAVLAIGNTSDYPLAQSPLYLGVNKAPLMMLVASRDEQLFNKAYSDYTNLQEGEDGDTGSIDTTYDNSFEYAGYFDPLLCYEEKNTRSLFKAYGKATNHQCSGKWSGNFLNWVTMSRLDIMRYVLYGGMRSTDTTSQTVLERAPVPNDLHAWVKVYSGGDIAKYVPSGTAPMSFCNATVTTDGMPLMRTASGSYTEWASTALRQCDLKGTADSLAKNDVPSSATDYTVRVDVCSNASAREGFCRSYSNGTNTYYKPAGLLQEYGESGKLRFGLVSGSYSRPRAGGVLRRNIGLFAGNGASNSCVTGDEVNLATGQFCWKISGAPAASGEGIVRTLDNFKLTQWSGSKWSDCGNYGILNRDAGGNGYLNDPGGSGDKSYACSAWGNPLAEMYAEALRYVSGDTSATSGFVQDYGNDLSGLPANISWKDPYRSESAGGNSYCASCNILVLSSGLPSFDANDVPGLASATSATKEVGDAEGLTNGQYFVGRVGAADNTTYADYCRSQVLSSLGTALGVCPDSPSTEGSYLIAGLAYKAHTQDLRTGHVPVGRSSAYKNTAKTFAVQMAESLPTFKIPVGTGAITLSPLCQANNTGAAKSSDSGWRTCFLGSVGVGKVTSSVGSKYVYGRDLEYSGTTLVAGSYKLVWEDSLWGNDHDNDVVTMLSFCVGAACHVASSSTYNANQNICWRSTASACASPYTVASNEVMVRLEVLSAYAGNALLSGFAVTGSNDDGTKRDLLRPGSKDDSLLTTTADPTSCPSQNPPNSCSWNRPMVYRFKIGNSSTGVLENPLWYAAKYGGFDDANGNGLPDAGEWDAQEPGTPDGYFLAHNPAKLKTRLEEIFEKSAGSNSNVGGGASGTSVKSDTFSVNASFAAGEKADWTGDVVATSVASGGTLGAIKWKASNSLPAASATATGRKVFVTAKPTVVDATGKITTSAVAAPFSSATNIPGDTASDKLRAMGFSTIPSWLQSAGDPANTATIDALITYLRGAPNASFRARSSALGDIVNSSPVVSVPDDDYGWVGWWSNNTDTTLKGLGTSYKSYLEAKESRGPTVYAGANDGMLHAFDGQTGKELFGFIPYSSLQHIGELANPEYAHQYYVDGPAAVADAYYGGNWHTVVIGTTGAGGAQKSTSSDILPQGSVFAMKVDTPASVSESDLLWDLSGRHDADLGQVIGTPAVVAVKSPAGARFVALFGNGADSGNGCPVLYAVDIGTGEVLARLKPVGTTYCNKNGLVSIRSTALKNFNGLADTVYGGDLQGHVWKFDLSSADPADWGLAYEDPLFSAVDGDGKAQPITGGIRLATGPGGGEMVYFGTGRYLTTEDPSDQSTQSLYGILDNMTSVISGGRDSVLARRTMAATTGSGSSYESRTVTGSGVNYLTQRGWYLDLVVGTDKKGERFIGTPTLQGGTIYFVTYTPTQGTDCGGGGENWEYGVNSLTGAGMLDGIADANGSTICTTNCGGVKLSSSSGEGGSANNAPVLSANIFLTQEKNKESTGQCITTNLPNSTGDTFLTYRACGRQSWRQLK